VLLVSRCRVGASLHETSDSFEVAAIRGLMQRTGRPLRELECALERQFEHRAEVRKGSLRVRGGHPDAQHAATLGERVAEHEGLLFG